MQNLDYGMTKLVTLRIARSEKNNRYALKTITSCRIQSKLINSFDYHFFYFLEEILYMIPLQSRKMGGLIRCCDKQCNTIQAGI